MEVDLRQRYDSYIYLVDPQVTYILMIHCLIRSLDLSKACATRGDGSEA